MIVVTFTKATEQTFPQRGGEIDESVSYGRWTKGKFDLLGN